MANWERQAELQLIQKCLKFVKRERDEILQLVTVCQAVWWLLFDKKSMSCSALAIPKLNLPRLK